MLANISLAGVGHEFYHGRRAQRVYDLMPESKDDDDIFIYLESVGFQRVISLNTSKSSFTVIGPILVSSSSYVHSRGLNHRLL